MTDSDCGNGAASARSESEHTAKPNEQWWNDRRSDRVLPSSLPDRGSLVRTGDTTAHTARSVHRGNVFLGTPVAGSFALRLPYSPAPPFATLPFRAPSFNELRTRQSVQKLHN